MTQAKIAIIGGSGVFSPEIFKKNKEVKTKTSFGYSSSIKIGDFSGRKIAFLIRHGKKNEIPPHRVNYKANIFALKKLGVKYIFTFSSVGSLKQKIKPGDFLICSDYIDFDPPTFFDKNPELILTAKAAESNLFILTAKAAEPNLFITPQISEELREVFIKTLKKLKLRFWPKGIYFNTKGPRLETKAEINLIKHYADVVGMTMAKEATLAQELNIEYACLCSIDNYAHGIGKKTLNLKEIKEGQKKNSKILEEIMIEISKSTI